jgi:transcriptional regulator
MEREDWETPDIPKPARLTDAEMRIAHRELKSGATKEALARYFNTTVSNISAVERYGDHKKW